MLLDRLPDVYEHVVRARDYILHKGCRSLYTANWKATEHGCIVYIAGTLDIHIRNTYHNAYHVSKRASRKEEIFFAPQKRGPDGRIGPNAWLVCHA